MPMLIPVAAGWAASALVGTSVVMGIGAVGWGVIAGAVAGGVMAATQDKNVLEGAIMGGLGGYAGAGLANAFSANGISGLTESTSGGFGKTGTALTEAQAADKAGIVLSETGKSATQAAASATPQVDTATTARLTEAIPEGATNATLYTPGQTPSPLQAVSPLVTQSPLEASKQLATNGVSILDVMKAGQPPRNALGMTTGETLGVAASLAPAFAGLGGESDAEGVLSETRAANERWKGIAPSQQVSFLYERPNMPTLNPRLIRS